MEICLTISTKPVLLLCDITREWSSSLEKAPDDVLKSSLISSSLVGSSSGMFCE